MTKEEEKTWRKYKRSAEPELRKRLIEKYLHLVKYAARRIFEKIPGGVDLEDLISAGCFGLMDAVEGFDVNRGIKFETYCAPRIRGAILDQLRQLDWVPRMVRSRANKMEVVYHSLEARLGRPPTDDEIAAAIGITLQEYRDFARQNVWTRFTSLNRKVGGDDARALYEKDLIEDKRSENPVHAVQRRDLKNILMKGLSANERLILMLYYYQELTMKEIGMVLGLSESRVSQMHASIMARLQAQLASRQAEFARE